MVFGPDVDAGEQLVGDHRSPTVSALPLVSVAGVVLAALLWAIAGWVDALACYVATMVLIGGIVLWLSRARREASPAALPVADAHPEDANTGFSLPASVAEQQAGLHRVGG